MGRWLLLPVIFCLSAFDARHAYADSIKVPTELNGVKVVQVLFLDRDRPVEGRSVFFSAPKNGRAKTPAANVMRWKSVVFVGAGKAVLGGMLRSQAYIYKD
jgi:hypothetical protein